LDFKAEISTTMSSESVSFSIVIPTFNRVALLRRAVASALGQTGFEPFEVLVGDDCSQDETWSYLQGIRSPYLRIFRNDRNLGMGANWNKAVAASRGRFIFILQDDDIALPGLLAVAASLFDRYRGARLLCFGTCLIDHAGQNPEMYWRPERETVLPAPDALLQFAARWTLSSTQVVFSRELYQKHAAFDLTLPIMSDADTILRWMLHADTILHPEPLALRRRWPGSVTAATVHSAAMAETMRLLVGNVMREAVASERLSAAQLLELEAALRNSFISPPGATASV
jgi:glycosyltransferase involved in cell wall biosynthesis